MNHDNTHHENIHNDEQTQQTDHQRFDAYIQQKIAQTIHTIKATPQDAQSDGGQKILSGLQHPNSDIYKTAVKEAIAEGIETFEQAENLSQDDIALLAILRNPPIDTDPRRQFQTADIPPNVMLMTVEKIQLGWARIDIAKQLMQQKPLPEWLHPLVQMDTTDAVNLLSQRLRTADPKSDKFSHNKYKKHADATKRTAQQELKERVYKLIDEQVKNFQQTDTDFAQLIEDAKKEMEQIEDIDQKRQCVKLWMSLQKQKDERATSFLTHFQRILEAEQKP